MKNFQNFTPQKYMTSDFQKISDGIYKTKSPYDSNDIFVTSLTFEMEPECYGEENASPNNLTQIPNLYKSPVPCPDGIERAAAFLHHCNSANTLRI